MVSTIATNEAHYSSFTSHHKQTNKQQATTMSTANNTNSTAHSEPSCSTHCYTCVLCDDTSAGYGNNPDPLATEGLCCDTCNFTKVIPARFAPPSEQGIQEEEEEDESEEEEEDEPEGDCCAGATDPRIVITYTMAGGGAHWWNYEVHYDIESGEQKELYINNKNGKEYQRGERLFHHEEHPDQLRIEARDFEQQDWHEMVHYA